MNSSQWMAVGFFLLVISILIPTVITGAYFGASLSEEGNTYMSVRNAIFSVIMWLSFPTMILCFVLAGLEHKR